MAKRDYRLFNWKLDDDTSKRHVYNWYGEELDDNELNKLRIGDCVRLMLISTEGEGMGSWEKIGDIISFQKNNVIEIPRWTDEELNPLKKQPNAEKVDEYYLNDY
ncbi:hypothetical protein BJ944DRAFT_263094 [Cunninghamella echinulata]|nr:hypothetical protein BJ944DRAFT_263094 [Cunninghamella echinulata]